MDKWKLGAVEVRFADIIWERAPLSSRELVDLCKERLEWKKSTTYTVLKKLCERGLFENNGGTVSACLTREAFYGKQSEAFVEESFHGSLPAFIAAFTKQRKLTSKEVAEIRSMIDSMGED